MRSAYLYFVLPVFMVLGKVNSDNEIPTDNHKKGKIVQEKIEAVMLDYYKLAQKNISAAIDAEIAEGLAKIDGLNPECRKKGQENLTNLKVEFKKVLMSCDLMKKITYAVENLMETSGVLPKDEDTTDTTNSLLNNCTSPDSDDLQCFILIIVESARIMNSSLTGITELVIRVAYHILKADTIVWTCVDRNNLENWIGGNVTNAIGCHEKINI